MVGFCVRARLPPSSLYSGHAIGSAPQGVGTSAVLSTRDARE